MAHTSAESSYVFIRCQKGFTMNRSDYLSKFVVNEAHTHCFTQEL